MSISEEGELCKGCLSVCHTFSRLLSTASHTKISFHEFHQGVIVQPHRITELIASETSDIFIFITQDGRSLACSGVLARTFLVLSYLNVTTF